MYLDMIRMMTLERPEQQKKAIQTRDDLRQALNDKDGRRLEGMSKRDNRRRPRQPTRRRRTHGEWHPVAFYSESMQGAGHNYPIHDKELMAVVHALIVWRSELMGL